MARGYANVKFEWNGSHSAVIENLGFGKELNRNAAEILYQHAFYYMPYVSGDLSTIVHIQALPNKANLVHTVKYANIQYTGEFPSGKKINEANRNKSPHDLATKEWYHVAFQHKKREITKEVDAARMKYRSFNYGK